MTDSYGEHRPERVTYIQDLAGATRALQYHMARNPCDSIYLFS